MSDDKRPRYPPLVPPRPSADANKELAERQREIAQRQSDHKIEVDASLQAMAVYLKKREAIDHDRDVADVVFAQELGAVDRMPARLQALASSLPPPQKPSHRSIHSNAARAARAAPATYLALAYALVELVRDVIPLIRPLFGGH